MTAPDFKPGDIIDGRFKVEREILGGNFSKMYLISDVNYPEIRQAMKINLMTEDIASTSESRLSIEISKEVSCEQRLANEINVLTALQHPNIPQLSGAVLLNDGYIGLTFPLLKHVRSLEEITRQAIREGDYRFMDLTKKRLKRLLTRALGKLPTTEHRNSYLQQFRIFLHFMKLFPQAVKTLIYLHCQGIQHRDIRPANILMDGSFSLYMIDYGLARRIPKEPSLCGDYKTDEEFAEACRAHEKWESDLREKRIIAGSYLYRAPEAYDDRYWFSADWWSLGHSFLRFLIGKHFVSEDRTTIPLKVKAMINCEHAEQNKLKYYKRAAVIFKQISDAFYTMFGVRDPHPGDTGCEYRTPLRYLEEFFEEETQDLESIVRETMIRFESYMLQLATFIEIEPFRLGRRAKAELPSRMSAHEYFYQQIAKLEPPSQPDKFPYQTEEKLQREETAIFSAPNYEPTDSDIQFLRKFLSEQDPL